MSYLLIGVILIGIYFIYVFLVYLEEKGKKSTIGGTAPESGESYQEEQEDSETVQSMKQTLMTMDDSEINSI